MRHVSAAVPAVAINMLSFALADGRRSREWSASRQRDSSDWTLLAFHDGLHTAWLAGRSMEKLLISAWARDEAPRLTLLALA
jgi:hypothetical protein